MQFLQLLESRLGINAEPVAGLRGSNQNFRRPVFRPQAVEQQHKARQPRQFSWDNGLAPENFDLPRSVAALQMTSGRAGKFILVISERVALGLSKNYFPSTQNGMLVKVLCCAKIVQ